MNSKTTLRIILTLFVFSSLSSVAQDGTSLATAGLNCNEIKTAYPSSPDGVYYIDIDGASPTWAPFRCYCDMTTDGGGWMLVNKSRFTALGPSKAEMTGDVTMIGVDPDPWSGQFMYPVAIQSQAAEFTAPTAPNYYPIGYNGDALLSPSDDLALTAPNENYAIMDRNLIEAMRNGLSSCGQLTDRKATIFKQVQGPTMFYLQSSKRFNPVQGKCLTATSVCTGADQSGCATDLITTAFSGYNAPTNDGAVPLPLTNWSFTCSHEFSMGGLPASIRGVVLPAGWMGGDSDAQGTGFYDCSFPDQATSGPLSTAANHSTFNMNTNASFPVPETFTTVWLKPDICSIILQDAQFGEFDYECQGDKTLLNWTTNSEKNTNRFEVMQSNDGEHFTLRATVEAVGLSSSISSYSVEIPSTPGTSYIKIYQFDNENLFSSSSMYAVTCLPPEVTLYPNPASDQVTIATNDFKLSTVKVYDYLGRIIFENTMNLSKEKTIDVSGLSDGLYRVEITDATIENKKSISVISVVH